MTAHKTGNLEHTAQPAGRATGWTVSFPVKLFALSLFSAELCFFPVAQLDSYCLSVTLTANICLDEEEPCESDGFQGLPAAFELFTS